MNDQVCQGCKSTRIAHVNVKTPGLATIYMLKNDPPEEPGYVPNDMNLTNGSGLSPGSWWDKYLIFDYCLGCGQIQGHWPLPICEAERKK